MVEKIRFSIIIPTYNNKELFKRALSSVLNQSYSFYEIIIVDDSSSTIIKECVENIRNCRLRYYHNVPSKGAVCNWNYGISLAKGEYLILLHHDEAFVGKDYLKRLNEEIEDVDVLVSNVLVYIDGVEKKNRIIKYGKKIMFRFPFLSLLVNVIGPTACVCLKRNNTQLFNESLVWLVDVEWYYRLLKSNRIKLCNEKVSSVFGHTGQITNTINIREEEIKDIKVLEHLYKYNIAVRLILVLRRVLNQLR